jgi:hypothetical protein
MGKKNKQNRKSLVKKAISYQDQYNIHQEKIKTDPKSFSLDHWKREKENFLTRINYYISKARVEKDDIIN